MNRTHEEVLRFYERDLYLSAGPQTWRLDIQNRRRLADKVSDQTWPGISTMSDAKEVKDSAEAPAKKKGKLPVIIAVVVVLLGGGFFGMKMKGGGAEKKPAV